MEPSCRAFLLRTIRSRSSSLGSPPGYWRSAPAAVEDAAYHGYPLRVRPAAAPWLFFGLWPALVDLSPAYGDYQARTEREIPLVVLSTR